MSTPDSAAVSLPEPLWKGRPLPQIGREVLIKYPVNREGRTAWKPVTGRVVAVSQPFDTQLIITLDDDKSYLINSSSLLDRWSYIESTPSDAARLDVIDPIAQHHHEATAEQLGLARLRADMGDDNPFGPDVSDEESEVIGEDIPDPHPVTLAGRMRRLAWLDDRIKAAEAEAAGYQAEYDQLCAGAIEQMAQEGVPSITVDDNTWFMKPRTYVEKVDGATPDDIREALRASGYGAMLTENYNSNSLRSLLIEFRDSEGTIPVPDKLAAVVRLGQTTIIGRTRAAARKRSPRPPLSS